MRDQAIYVALPCALIGGPEYCKAPVAGSCVENITKREFLVGSISFVETNSVCVDIPISPVNQNTLGAIIKGLKGTTYLAKCFYRSSCLADRES